jgi:hypothetical protein
MRVGHEEVKRRFVALAALGLAVAGAGCATQPQPGDAETGAAREADVSVEVTAPHPFLNPECNGAGDFAVHNAGYPSRETGTCESTDDFDFDDAVLACGGAVKYFSYSCSDFAGGRRGPQLAWTAYYGCCACDASTCPAPGVCNGNRCVQPQPPASQMVNAGESAHSAHYRAVYTLGQPTQNQGKSTSTSYRVQGGLIGANGSVP